MEYEVVENYKLYDKITETGGASLYRASSTSDADSEDCFYVIKTYHNENIPEEMLVREKNISHEIELNTSKSIVIPILEVIKDGKYAVMQFRKNGLFLNELLAKLEEKYTKGKIPLEVVLDVIHKILSSLSVLHSFLKNDRRIGYLHMDLHPGNIFFESADFESGDIGTAKFLDFFSARRLEEGKVIQDAGLIDSVTKGYSSPEQANRDYDLYGPYSDLFSVGAIFYRMLIGYEKSDFESITEYNFFERIKDREEHSVVKYTLLNFFGVCMNENTKYRYKCAEKMMHAVELLKQCHSAYKDKKYYTLLEIGYRMIVPEDKVEPVNDEFSIGEFETAVNQLECDLTKDIVDRNKCVYMCNCLVKYVERHKNDIPDTILFRLLRSAMACYSHIGDSTRAKVMFEEIEKIKNKIPTMEYLGCLNRAAVIYSDRYEFEKAHEIICKNIRNKEAIRASLMEIAKDYDMELTEERDNRMELARAYSAKGTYMVFAGLGDPMTEFNKALDTFGDSVGNKSITISHILQYAIEIKNIDLYEEYSKQYFDKYDTLGEGLDNIIQSEKISPFSLLVFLKGIYTFYMDKVDENCIKKIKNLLNMSILTELHAHPVQLIYRYIGLILYKYAGEMTEEADNAMIASIQCIPNGNIILDKPLNILMCITYHMMWIYNELTSQDDENTELLDIMKEHCRLSGWDKVYNILEETKQIQGIFTYEYA